MRIIKTVPIKSFFLTFTLLIGAFNAQSAVKYPLVEWTVPSAKFADLHLDSQKIADLAQGGQFLIVSHPQDFTSWNARTKKNQNFKNQKVIYAATVIDAPADEIREMVWDMKSQGDFSPLLSKTKNIRTEGNSRIASMNQIIKLTVIKLNSNFVVQINQLDNGDIGMVLVDEGDVESLYQYWEFFPLDDNKTLTVLSGWQDTDSASFMYKTVLEAEPSIGKVFPVLTMYERLVQFKNEAAKRHPENAQRVDNSHYDIRSINGYLSDNEGLDLNELKKLTLLGSIQLYQTSKTLSYQNELHDIIQVTAIAHVPLPKKTIRPLLNDFSSIPEYNDLTRGWLTPKTMGEEWGHLQIGANIGPIFIPVEIYPVLENQDTDKMNFYVSDHSYMSPLFGHIEHIELPNLVDPNGAPTEEGTIVEWTIGGVIGPDASFLFKMARYLPFHDVLIVATYAMLCAESMGDWVEQRVYQDNVDLEAQKVADAL